MLKVTFSDFWPDFDYHNNFFINLIKEVKGEDNVQVVPFDQADVLIYSCFGNNHHSFDGCKIYYTGENIRLNFDECNYSMTFDFEDYSGRNVRVPLWMLQIDWYNKKPGGNPKYALSIDNINRNEFIETTKNKFCVTVFNNNSPYRFETVHKLNNYKQVTAYGKPFNNWFYGEDTKYRVLSEHKFNICYENTIYPGYYTEKLFHAKTAGCIPIYWCDSHSKEDFNSNCFINLSDYNNDVDEMIEHVKEIDSDNELYNKYTRERLFNKDITLDSLAYIGNFLNRIL